MYTPYRRPTLNVESPVNDKQPPFDPKLLASLAKLNPSSYAAAKAMLTHLLDLERLAFHDAVTGLANRHYLDKQQNAPAGSVLMVDLDRFKEVNDSYGHDVGDLVLREAARRLCGEVHSCEVVARLGGDEFVMLLTENENNDVLVRARHVADKVIASMMEAVIVDGKTIFIGASVGIAVHKGNNFARAQAQADTALYFSKNTGKGRASVYDPTMPDRRSVPRE